MKNSTALILLLLSAGLVFTFILPNYDKVMALRAQESQYKEIVDSIADLGQKRDDLAVVYDSIPATEVERLEKVLPSNVDTVTLAMNFDSIAAKYGISIKSIRPIENANEASAEIVQDSGGRLYQPAVVTFAFVASYDDFRGFMFDIEQSLRIIDIESVSFEASETGLYDFEVSVKTYWLK